MNLIMVKLQAYHICTYLVDWWTCLASISRLMSYVHACFLVGLVRVNLQTN